MLQSRLTQLFISYEPVHEKTNNLGFPTRSDSNQAVQSQKIARSFKFRMKEEEGLYYPYRENKGADQLCSYCTADLRLCFRLCILLVFSCGGSYSNGPKFGTFLS